MKKTIIALFLSVLFMLVAVPNTVYANENPFNEDDVRNVFTEFSDSFTQLPIAKQLLLTIVKYSLVVAFVIAVVSTAMEIVGALTEPTRTIGLFRRIATKWVLWIFIGGSLQIANYIFGLSNAIIG